MANSNTKTRTKTNIIILKNRNNDIVILTGDLQIKVIEAIEKGYITPPEISLYVYGKNDKQLLFNIYHLLKRLEGMGLITKEKRYNSVYIIKQYKIIRNIEAYEDLRDIAFVSLIIFILALVLYKLFPFVTLILLSIISCILILFILLYEPIKYLLR